MRGKTIQSVHLLSGKNGKKRHNVVIAERLAYCEVRNECLLQCLILQNRFGSPNRPPRNDGACNRNCLVNTFRTCFSPF